MNEFKQIEDMKRQKHLVDMMNRSLRFRDEMQNAQQHENNAQIELNAPLLVQNMNEDAQIDEPAPAAEVKLSRSERKKLKERQKALKKSEDQHQNVKIQEATLTKQRVDMSLNTGITEQQLQAEKDLIKEKLKAIALDEEYKLLANENADESEILNINYNAQLERAKLAGEFARMLPLGSKERKKAMAEKEKQELGVNPKFCVNSILW